MTCRWSVAQPQPDLALALASAFSISRLFAQCLLNRGSAEPAAISVFLRPRLRDLFDPFLLPDMGLAVDRLFTALQKNESVVVFGDYDVDGVTSTALVMEILQALGWQVQSFLPNRLDDGYGLTKAGVEKCLEKHPASLLLALDCGSNAVSTITWLVEQHIDVIVLDHHQIASPPPPALALVNPQRHTDHSAANALTDYCTAGLAFKLAHALLKHGRELQMPAAQEFDLKQTLDLVALGTIADLAPLRGENRILVAAGLARLNTTRRPGLIALKQIAQVSAPVTVVDVAYQLGPRLNAAGRLEDAEIALKLLQSQDATMAAELAKILDERNRERQTIERDIASQAVKKVAANFNPNLDFVIVEGKPVWHVGVVGIVASRILRQFYRPTIIVGGEGESWRGSGRSIPGFDLAEALRACDDLLIRHGGHAMAAGLTVPPDNMDPLRSRLNELAHQKLTPKQLKPILDLDSVVILADMTEDQVLELMMLEPLGQGNPAVQLAAKNVICASRPQRLGKDQQHVKMWVTDGSATRETVWWNAGDSPMPQGKFHLAFTPKINEYNGQRSVQLNFLDWKTAK